MLSMYGIEKNLSARNHIYKKICVYQGKSCCDFLIYQEHTSEPRFMTGTTDVCYLCGLCSRVRACKDTGKRNSFTD